MRLASLCNIPSPDSFFSAAGDDIKILYKGFRKTSDSPLQLVPDGKLSISEYVNSFGCTTDMSYILARIKAGDSSVLFASNSGYGDTTIFPTNPAEALGFINNATAYFDQLPDSVRSKFNNSFADWIASAGSQEWISKMVSSNSPVDSGTVSDVDVSSGDLSAGS